MNKVAVRHEALCEGEASFPSLAGSAHRRDLEAAGGVSPVISAEARIQSSQSREERDWTPAFAGVAGREHPLPS